MMRKTALALTILATIGTSALATNYYDVDMYYLRDRSKTLTVEDKQHTGDLAVSYLGRGISESAVDQAVADIQSFLNQKYGEGQYFVYTDKDVSDHHMNIYVTKDANQVPAPTAQQAAVPASTVLADGGIVLQLTDFTKEMAAVDREQITAILGNYTYGDSAANLAERAEDAAEHYLDQKYGDDFYDVDVKKVADGAYDIQIKADDHYKSPGTAVAPDQPAAAQTHTVLELMDYTKALPAEDRAAITAILGNYTYGDSTANLAERAEDAVEHYLDQKYGDDVYDVDRVSLGENAFRIELKADKNYGK
ncbi:MAG: hypothetical protein E6Z25_00470 [Negativicoccus succinicivorans]|uniref:hypothetical protein n=1 Tax=Negativicoccus succinicivorans TaxID=620903 RepID=UPI0029095710|nr:hypothetical protein [Negativicoccus succinicivorans]MDU5914531.1 hypothetical protein [Negativicoccus succinicivorans]